MHDVEKKFDEKFSEREIASVVQIVDTKLKGADIIIDSVTPENLDVLIEIFVKSREKRRQTINEEHWDDLSIAGMIADKKKRNCQPHAIQCDIQGAKDTAFILDKLNDKNVSKENPDFQKVVLFLQREVKLRLNLAEFHRVDIARRIGDFKKDDNFYLNEKDRFEKALPVLIDLIEDYENFNKGKFELLSDEDFKQVQEDLDYLRRLSSSDFEKLKSSYYEEVCERFGRLIFCDWQMNVGDLTAEAENI